MVVVPEELIELIDFLNSHPLIDKESLESENTTIRVTIAGKLPLILYTTKKEEFASLLFQTTGNEDHLRQLKDNYKLTFTEKATDETEIYARVQLPYFEPELREGRSEFNMIKNGNMESHQRN